MDLLPVRILNTERIRATVREATMTCFAVAVLTLVFPVLVGGQSALAQDTEPVQDLLPTRTDTLRVTGPGPFLIRPFLDATTVSVAREGVLVDQGAYMLDAARGLILFPNVGADSSMTLVVSYRHVPVSLASSYQLWPEAEDTTRTVSGAPPREDALQSALETRGSITRGVTTGSNQDARIESGLRLQVEGEVAPGIQLNASLTDEDTPLVPEGVTRQLDQFDRIRISLQSDDGRVDLGDFETRLDATRYGRLNRRLQGASVSTSTFRPETGWMRSIKGQTGVAISRGLFRSTALAIRDGVQGPYRLTGNGGERFILLLPGSERVYLDGALLERGPSEDYIVDYNTAEITFTAKRIVGRDSRVRVEYEYTTNRYTRTLTFAEALGAVGRPGGRPLLEWAVSAIREADGDAFTDELGLSSEDSLLVASSPGGDVRVSGASEVAYSPESLYTQYFRVDDGTGNPVFREVDRAPASGEPVFRVVFSFVGERMGTYQRVPSLSGGVAYEYVGPGAGGYVPERTLPVPTSKVLTSFRAATQALPGLRLEAGMAVSALDQNRLSSSGASSIHGHAWDVSVAMKPVSLGGWSWMVQSSVHRRQAGFETFERVRDVEFIRQWNVPIQATDPTRALVPGAHEWTAQVMATLSGPDSSRVETSWEQLEIGRFVDADRMTGRVANVSLGPLTWTGEGQIVSTKGVLGEEFATDWSAFRNRLDVEVQNPSWQPWLEWERERFAGNDPILRSPDVVERRVPMDEWRAGVDRSNEDWRAGVMIEQRTEQERPGLSLLPYRFRTVQLNVDWSGSSRWQTSWTGGLRVRDAGSSGALPTPDDAAGNRSVLMTWTGQASLGDVGRLRWDYDIRSEQTAAMQEVFLRTGPERGSFVWDDLNDDGVIQIDEYLPESVPGEGDYARVLFPSDSLESVTTASFRLSIDRNARSGASRWQRFSSRTMLDVSESSRNADQWAVAMLRPSVLRMPGSTINGRLRLSQQIGFFPLSIRRDLDMTLLHSGSLNELAAGTQENRLDEATLRWREEIDRQWDGTLEIRRARDESRSDRYASRSYRIDRWEAQPGVVWKNGAWRVHGRFVLAQATDVASDIRVIIRRAPIDAFWSRPRMTWRTGLEYASASLKGGIPIGLQLFELTEGRGQGVSWLWNLRMDARLTDVITATARYDGRKPDGAKAIHTGRLQLTARF